METPDDDVNNTQRSEEKPLEETSGNHLQEAPIYRSEGGARYRQGVLGSSSEIRFLLADGWFSKGSWPVIGRSPYCMPCESRLS